VCVPDHAGREVGVGVAGEAADGVRAVDTGRFEDPLLAAVTLDSLEPLAAGALDFRRVGLDDDDPVTLAPERLCCPPPDAAEADDDEVHTPPTTASVKTLW